MIMRGKSSTSDLYKQCISSFNEAAHDHARKGHGTEA